MAGTTSRQRAIRRGVTRSVAHGAETIAFELVRSDRRTVGFVVEQDGRVVVRAPRRARESDVLHAVSRHGDWILRTRRRVADAARHRHLCYREGELHLYIGRPYPLAVMPCEHESVRVSGGRLLVAARPEDRSGRAAVSPERVKRVLDEWYEREAKRILADRLEVCWASFPSNGHRRPPLRVKRMRTRWGSMSPKGRMSLRLDLVRAPLECIDYVIVHELCHLVHPHHRQEFWELVGELMPEWRERKRRLERLLA